MPTAQTVADPLAAQIDRHLIRTAYNPLDEFAYPEIPNLSIGMPKVLKRFTMKVNSRKPAVCPL